MLLHPSNFRLMSKMGVVIDEVEEERKPVNYFNDSLLATNYPELQDQEVTLADLRYQWALLRVFNNYLAPAVPFINTSQSFVMSDIVPSTSIPMKLAAYMSSTRNLCLLNVKFDLRHLILEKTSVQVDHPSKLYFERLKLARSREREEDNDNGSDEVAAPELGA